ncbi:MAG TPA: hypothetical protein PK843_03370 [bacterium]|nr:hypothetical protein [bacterium]HPN33525.1 hypothetical protein [bacterium]
MLERHTQSLHLLYLSGELSYDQQQALHEHHRDCRICRLDLQQMQETLQLYRSAGAETVSPAVTATLLAEARRRQLTAWQWWISQRLHVDWHWARAMALTAFLVLLAVMVARLPQQNSSAMLAPLITATSATDAYLSDLQRRLLVLESGSVRPGRNLEDQDRSDALVDDELRAIRMRMNDLARDILID